MSASAFDSKYFLGILYGKKSWLNSKFHTHDLNNIIYISSLIGTLFNLFVHTSPQVYSNYYLLDYRYSKLNRSFYFLHGYKLHKTKKIELHSILLKNESNFFMNKKRKKYWNSMKIIMFCLLAFCQHHKKLGKRHLMTI